MKKNITINLCGRLFQIDEDAYELLQNYIESLRASFGKQEGGEEIADDIEARVAELFDELKANGIEAITIEHVKDIITRIGKPEELAGEDDTQNAETQNERQEGHRYDSFRTAANGFRENVRARTAGKKLYRNPNDKLLAGVLSGFATYTNTDPTWWRIGYALLILGSNFFLLPLFRFLFNGGFFFSINLSFILFYIAMAIAMPEAKKPKQVLEMEGKDVTPQSLADVVIDDQQPVRKKPGLLRDILSVFLKIIIGLFVTIAVIVGAVLGIAFLGVLMTTIFALVMPATIHMPFTLGGMELTEVWYFHPYVLIGFAVALLAVLFIPVYAITHMVLAMAKKIRPMGLAQRIVWTVLWVIALGFVITLGTTVIQYHNEFEHQRRAENYGWMTDEQRDFLNGLGMKIDRRHHCYPFFVKSGEYFTGDPTVTYIDVEMWGPENERIFQVSMPEEEVEPGTYRVSCNGRADSGGVMLFATAYDGSLKATYMIGASAIGEGREGGRIWDEAAEKVKSDSLPEAKLARKIREANGGKGYGWERVEIELKIDAPTTIRYGVSTDRSFTEVPCYASWFSVADFKLERIEETEDSQE